MWQECLGLQAQEAASQGTLRELLRGGEGEELGYSGILQQRAGSQNIKLFRSHRLSGTLISSRSGGPGVFCLCSGQTWRN